MRRILVTGGTGFIGRHVIGDLKARGFETIVVGRKDPESGTSFDLLRDDPRTIVELMRADTLVHIAWCTEHGKFWSAPENLDWLAATLRLARAFREAGGTRLLAVGTGAEYGNTPRTTDIQDEEHTSPETIYGECKDACRRVLASYSQRNDLSFCWARIFMTYGPGEDRRRLIPSTINALRNGREAQCSSGEQLRDIIHVVDAGRAISLLATSDVQGPVNIGSGQTATISQIVTILGEISGRPDLVRLGALPDRENDPPRLTVTAAALRSTGFTSQISLRKGLELLWR